MRGRHCVGLTRRAGWGGGGATQADYVLSFYDEARGLVNAPGPLWIDVLVREGYTSDTNAFMRRAGTRPPAARGCLPWPTLWPTLWPRARGDAGRSGAWQRL